MGFERKMTGFKKPDFSIRDIALESLGPRRQEEWIIPAPNSQKGRPGGAEEAFIGAAAARGGELLQSATMTGGEREGGGEGQGDERQLAMQPSRLSEFITIVRERFEEAAREGEAPVLVTSSNIRPFVRGIVERFRAQTPVLSQGEIHPRARLKTVSSI